MHKLIIPEEPCTNKTKLYIRNMKKCYDWSLIHPMTQDSPSNTREWSKEIFMSSITSTRSILIVTSIETIPRELQICIARHPSGMMKRLWHVIYLTKDNKEIKMEFELNGFFKEPWPNNHWDVSYRQAMDLLCPVR
jgi:hypothetical protein